MDFGEILTRAWHIIWRHKILWLFGILASCGANAGSSGSNSNFRIERNYNFQELPPQWQNFFDQLSRRIESIPVWVWILLAVAGIVLFLLVVVLQTIGHIGLIKGAQLADEGAATLSLGSLLSASLPYFWRVLLLNVLVGVVIFIVVMVAIVVLVVLGIATLGIGLVCLGIPLFCLLFIASIAIGLLMEMTIIAIVTENLGIMAALERAWSLLRSNVGSILVIALILMVGGWIVGLILAIPLFLVVLPPIIAAAAGSRDLFPGSLAVTIALLCILAPILIVAQGIVRSYTGTAWTLTFRRLAGRKPLLEPVVPAQQL